MYYRKIVAAIFIVSVASGLLRGDEIIFTNGDKLSGTIKQMADGKVRLESEVAGTVIIDMTKIQSFSTDTPVKIHLQDGTVLNQKLTKAEQGNVKIETGELIQAQEIKLSSIKAINPPEIKKPKWTGDISVGISSTHGNTGTESRNASINLKHRGEDDRILLTGDYARGEQENPDTGEDEVTENWWKTRAKYDYFLNKKTYLYADSRYEKDSIAELDRRIIAGGGVGYQWIESEQMNFSTEAGLTSLYEKYENQTESNSDITGQLGYHFDKKINSRITFINDLTYYPIADDISDYYLTSTAELRANITENMFTNFKVIFGYDASPAEDADKTDTKYILGAGFSF